MKKRVFVCFVVCLLILPIWASNFVIRDYSFSIEGKTQEWVVRNLVIPENDESFSSLEELISSLNNKKQLLDNKRVFKSVEYTLSTIEEVGDTTYVDVLFNLVDARTTLVIPYPKYDSNYGARIGLKYYNTNLMGTFSNLNGTAHGTFTPWDFNTLKYFAEFDLSDFYIGKTKVSAKFTGNATQTSGVSDYALSTSISDIMLGRYSMNINLGFNKDSETKYTLSSSFYGLKLGSVSFTPSLSATVYEKAKSSSTFTLSLSTTGMSIGSVGFSFSDAIEFYNTQKSDGVYNWKATKLTHSTNFSFTGEKLSRYSYSHTLTYSPKSSFKFDNTLGYKLSDITTLYLYENLIWNGDWFLSTLDTGVGISQQIKIGDHITITPTLKEFLTTSFKPNDETVYFSRYYLLSGSTSGNYVNWKGNFRDGIKYSISISEGWDQNYGNRTAREVHDYAELSAFKIIGSWFNPSLRIIVNYTNNISSYGSITGSSSGDFGEYLRGIRNDTLKNDGRDKNIFAIVTNVNILSVFPLPSFISFADAYINLFVDYAFTKHAPSTSESDMARHYLGFGIEGIGIFKEYPSYPIRASLGFDARKLMAYVKGEGERDFYEIYVGLDFFF